MVRKGAIQRKQINEGTKEHTNVNHDKQTTKNRQQPQLTQREHLLDYSTLYVVVDTRLDFDKRDPSSTLDRTFCQFFFDDAE